jgi:non-canonical poly(A) RNA polymerase PAPD5/7
MQGVLWGHSQVMHWGHSKGHSKEEIQRKEKMQDTDDFIKFDFEDEYFQESEEEKKTEFRSKELLIDIPIPPWIPHDKIYSNDLLEMLHQEMDDYINFIQPTDAEHYMRSVTVQRIEKVVQSIWHGAQVEVFGSFDTLLYLPSSDVDIVVFDEEISPPSCLWKLKDALNRSNIYSNIEVITGAKVPIIKLTDAFTKLNVDISFNIVGGVEAAKLVKQFLKDKQCGHGIKALMLILKQFLSQRRLNEVFLGGLGSYGLLIMITSFLKMHPLIQAGVIKARDNLGVLLIEFFELYGRQMNYDEVGMGVDLERGAWYYSKV